MRRSAEISSNVAPASGTAARVPLGQDRGHEHDSLRLGQVTSKANGLGSAIHVLAVGVGIAALVEFLLLRIGLRLGAVVPYEGVMEAFTRLSLLIGTTALNFAMLGGVLLLFLLLIERWYERPGWLRRATSSWLAVVALFASVLAALWYFLLGVLPFVGEYVPVGEMLSSQLVVISAVATLIFVCIAWTQLPRLAVFHCIHLLLAGAFLLALHFGFAARSVGAVGQFLPGATTALGMAEVLIVATILWSPIVFRPRPQLYGIVLTVVVTGIAGGLLYGTPWIARTMGIWTVAFTLYLPALIYVVAAAVATFTIASVLLGRTVAAGVRVQGLGLLLLLVGGMKPDFSYLAILGILGLMLLSRAGHRQKRGRFR